MPRALTLQSDVTTDPEGRARLSQGVSRQIAAVLRLYVGRRVQIVVSPPKRSNAANSYYWAAVIPEVQRGCIEAGYLMDADDVHTMLKKWHLPMRTVETPDGPETKTGSTANLDSTAFYEYIESIRTDERLLRMGCDVPEPAPKYRSYRIVETRRLAA